jgi:hypothetical protein
LPSWESSGGLPEGPAQSWSRLPVSHIAVSPVLVGGLIHIGDYWTILTALNPIDALWFITHAGWPIDRPGRCLPDSDGC